MEKNTLIFAELFKKYRLKSQFVTLTQLADLLAENGFIYDISIFSHWQKGTRVPKNRKLILILLKIFFERGGITTEDEANLLIESTGLGYLTSEEKKIFQGTTTNSPFLVPNEVGYFTGRDREIDSITQALSHKQIALISGLSGIGKTSLAIKFCHLFRHKFPDGVLWARVDTTNTTNILTNFARVYNEYFYSPQDIESRAQIVRRILSSKKTLVVFDNVNTHQELDHLLPSLINCSVIITTQRQNLLISPDVFNIRLNSFNNDESVLLLTKIIGKEQTITRTNELSTLSEILGNLPFAITLLGRKLRNLQSENIETISQTIKNNLINYLQDHDESLKTSFELSYSTLSEQSKIVFSILGIFEGTDFSIETIRVISGLSRLKIYKVIEELVDRSLIQSAEEARYSLHPIIKLISLTYLTQENIYEKTILYYLAIYKKYKEREKVKNTQFFAKEIDNIIGIFIKLPKNKSQLMFSFWDYLVLTLWDLGMWNVIIQLSSKLLQKAILENNYEFQAKCLIRDLGLVYFQRGDIKKAYQVIKKGSLIAVKNNNPFLIAYARLRLGMILLQDKKVNDSLISLNNALESFMKLKEYARVGEALCYMGNAYLRINNVHYAEEHVRKAYTICKSINHKRCISDSLSYLGEIYLSLHDYKKAKHYFLRSLKIDKQIGRHGQIWIYNTAALRKLTNTNKQNNKEQNLYESVENNKLAKIYWRLADLDEKFKNSSRRNSREFADTTEKGQSLSGLESS